MSEELKPCPFCGGEAEAMLSQSRWGQSYTIHHDAIGKCPAGYVSSMSFRTEAEAIAAWNARADTEYGSVPATDENMAKHGWVRERTCHDTEEEPKDFCCSECGARLYIDTGDSYTMIAADEQTIIKRPNYCPNCGAKVVGA